MTPAIDPHRRFQRQVALQVSLCWIFVLFAAVWAWRVPVPTDPTITAARSAKSVTAPTATTAINAAIWNVNLWRPFSGGDSSSTLPTAPMAIKLFSILQQGDGLSAAVAAGDNGSLQYVKAGDICGGATVVRVEANGVVLRINGQEQWLGLGQ